MYMYMYLVATGSPEGWVHAPELKESAWKGLLEEEEGGMVEVGGV